MSNRKYVDYFLRDAAVLILLAAFSYGLGEVVRARQYQAPGSSRGLRTPDVAEDLSVEKFSAFVKSNKGLVLDGRSLAAFASGHVPGAHSFPANYFEGAYMKLKSPLEADRNQVIAVYCSEAECHSSRLIQRMLADLGFRHVAVFPGGWKEWQRAGLPEERNP